MVKIVGIGGTTNAQSSVEAALRIALDRAEAGGAEVTLFGSDVLVQLPLYGTLASKSSFEAQSLLAAVRSCDGLILASPGYHGSISGLVKNAIDYIEETSQDARVYFDGMPVDCPRTSGLADSHGRSRKGLSRLDHARRMQ
jgi:FMN reductase